ncbi:hypothetical protein [Halarcobacter sp.]|uniref:sulfotransferase family protein n=1 Tax=Halarcobacter sp. TaxID=2321133 RepID=UPI0029F4A61C|nr:hypothetical protein [Halarcobacter sp.]
MKKCIVVLGMHRSGTSALTGVLDICDIKLGNNIMGESEFNAKGHFENLEIVNFNEKLLEELNSTWYSPNGVNEELYKELLNNTHLINKAKTLIIQEFGDNELIAIKDPRMCFLFDFWEKVLTELNYEIDAILLYREPLDIAKSLERRDYFEYDYSILLWLKYAIYAEKLSRNHKRIFLSYNQLLNDPESVLKMILENFNIDDENIDKKSLLNFVDKKLQNSQSDTLNDIKLISYIKKCIKLYKEIIENGYKEEFKKDFDEIFDDFNITSKSYFNSIIKTIHYNEFNKEIKDKKLHRKIKNFLKRNSGK